MSRQEVFVIVDAYPIVVDQTTRGCNRKVSGDLGSYLLKADHAIEFAIDPDSATRADYGAGFFADAQSKLRELPLDLIFVNAASAFP